MIQPLLTHGRILFTRSHCNHCQKWKDFIYKLNFELKINKRIQVIDCTQFFLYGIYDHPIIKLFEDYIEEFPTLFFEGERKSGSNSTDECASWLITRLILENDFIFPRSPEYLEELGRYNIFNLKCKKIKGRIYCKEIE